jgi:virginiamycin B lyase
LRWLSPSRRCTHIPRRGLESAIAAGSNALWFTEYLTGRIGRITIEGTIHDAGTPTPNSYPAGIAVRGSGGVWFTESGGNNIGVLRSG